METEFDYYDSEKIRDRAYRDGYIDGRSLEATTNDLLKQRIEELEEELSKLRGDYVL